MINPSSKGDNSIITYKNFPEKLIFSLTSNCNLRCWHCTRSLYASKGHEAPKALIDYVNRKILPRCKYLSIGGNEAGEPLLSKNFNYFLTNLNNSNLKRVVLTTNLTLLNKKKAELIVKKFDGIYVSVEGTGHDYYKIRKFSWNHIVNNIRLLNRVRKQNHSNSKITLWVCTILGNFNSLPDLFDLKKIGVEKIRFQEFMPFEYLIPTSKKTECLWNNPDKTTSLIKKLEKKSKETGIPIDIEFKDRYVQSDKSKTFLSNKLRDCFEPWNNISIDSSGNISCCCKDTRLGKITDYNRDILDILNEDKFIRFRQTINTAKNPIDCLYCEIKTGNLSIKERNKIIKSINPFKKGTYFTKKIYNCLNR